MTQSKQELAERNARIRAEKLRENLSKRKQQARERKLNAPDDGAKEQVLTQLDTNQLEPEYNAAADHPAKSFG